MTTGDLIGIPVYDNDRFVWVGGAIGSEVWIHIPFPKVSGERGGILWSSGTDYIIGDVVTEAGKLYFALTGTTGTPNTNKSPAANITDWEEVLTVVPAETGGKAWNTTLTYTIGDMVATTPGGFIHHAVTANTSIDPSTDDGTNWTQPGLASYIPTTYNFTTDLLSTNCSSVPAGPHNAITPDENGPCWFSVGLGSAGRVAEVQLEGYELNPIDYDVTVDGYVKILSPVADNSWLKVVI